MIFVFSEKRMNNDADGTRKIKFTIREMTKAINIIKTSFSKNDKIEVHYKDGRLLKLSSTTDNTASVQCNSFTEIDNVSKSSFYNNTHGELRVVNTMTNSAQLETSEIDIYDTFGTYVRSLMNNESIKVNKSIVSTYPMLNINWKKSIQNLFDSSLLPEYDNTVKEYLTDYKNKITEIITKIEDRLAKGNSDKTGTDKLTVDDYHKILKFFKKYLNTIKTQTTNAIETKGYTTVNKSKIYDLDVIGETPKNYIDNYDKLDVYTVVNDDSISIVYMNFTGKPVKLDHKVYITALYFNYLDEIIKRQYTVSLENIRKWGKIMKESNIPLNSFMMYDMLKTTEDLVKKIRTIQDDSTLDENTKLIKVDTFNFEEKSKLALSALTTDYNETVDKLVTFTNPTTTETLAYIDTMKTFMDEVIVANAYYTNVKFKSVEALEKSIHHKNITDLHENEFEEKSLSYIGDIEGTYQSFLEKSQYNKFKWMYISAGMLLITILTYAAIRIMRK